MFHYGCSTSPRRLISSIHWRTAIGLAAAAFSILITHTPAFAISASTADDVCAPDANPCNVTSVIDVVDGSVLDFGSRSVNVQGGGFNFGTGSGRILCGPFDASTGVAIDAGDRDPLGGTDSGSVLIAARRRCDAGPTEQLCVDDQDCQAGTCTARRCEGGEDTVCSEDADCQLGACAPGGQCENGIVSCTTNSDCDLGACPAQLTCSSRAYTTVNCAMDEDCDFGSCTVGEASISMNGSISGSSDFPAFISLRAANSVTISKQIQLSSRSRLSDGGELEVYAAAGTVMVDGRIRARGGREGMGGFVGIDAGEDIQITESIDVEGGDFDGGEIELAAGRDLQLDAFLSADSRAGAGSGGQLRLTAGRDLTAGSPASARDMDLGTRGHGKGDFDGDGGFQELYAGGNLTLYSNVELDASTEHAIGGTILLGADGDIMLDAILDARGTRGLGKGGHVEIVAAGKVSTGLEHGISVIGGSEGGGTCLVNAGGDIVFGGWMNASSSSGVGGTAELFSSANVSIYGSMRNRGKPSGDLRVEACRITLHEWGSVDSSRGGTNRLIAHESMRLMEGSFMDAEEGSNILVYRTALKPPVLNGTVTPAPVLTVDGLLVGCPVCGNEEIDEDETCDDGNVLDGDGCSSACQTE